MINSEELQISLVQMCSGPNIEENLLVCESMIAQAKKDASQLILFPECVLSWAKTEITQANALTRDEWISLLGPYAKENNMALLWGGLAERDGSDIFNSSFIFDAGGELIDCYRKSHLFQIFASDKLRIDETDTYQHGDTGPVSFDFFGWRIGVSICYDLRFPEFYRLYAGHDLIVNTAAFTRRTGRAHWEILMRARAIENQCYVLGAAQCGRNELTGISAYGHSVAIDPWGTVLADLGEEVSCRTLKLEKKKIEKVRAQLPALLNRKY